ncbi:hypothetical protein CSB45_01620 [candidate division KSB3 bacterium]|uniref:Uncharacterized protein n=1 Tax=candidate division KSB3 bacterium TaxID=2044937 RepID=A0A2G6EBJ5_9BACT|nr:MAG: hypothetical protein CSB45_01620 [candidate division KSB3 bacterium]PIE30710.1 MAG: hypothetical protein CSA57_01730 [candidate division KSB3 bacterium]
MSLPSPQLPENATESYLEKVAEKIYSHLHEIDNIRIKERLQSLLAAVEERLLQMHQQAQDGDDEERSPSSTSQPATLDLSPEDYGIIKKRMTDMLHGIKKEKDEDEGILELGEEEEIEQPSDLSQQFMSRDAEHLPLHGDTLVAEPDRELTFSDACRRVGQGEAPALLEQVDISEREQEMLAAFTRHLSQMKGLKRQQIFEMQHMTGRSIRELEQIFKTYHLQGYLRAELNNVYNRLLNLRSRFSILQH